MVQKETKEKLNFSYARRLGQLPGYLFVEIDRKKKELIKQGVDIINLGIGDPDQPTFTHIVEAMKKALDNSRYHHYPMGTGLEQFRQVSACWYKKRFGVEINSAKEIYTLIGSKEGIGHFPLAFINPGDVVLIPEPAYPVYTSSTIFAGGTPYYLPLLEKNNFLPDFSSVPQAIREKAKLLFLNYPNNPTAAVADKIFFEEVIRFADKNGIIVVHDAAYSEIYFEGEKPISFLEVEGAKEVGVEFHSLSKTYNMTGWRIGFVVGNEKLIKGLSQVKDNFDSGVFDCIQVAGMSALEDSQEAVEKIRQMYKRRRDILVEGLRKLGWDVKMPQATFYVWTKVPGGCSSTQCATKLLEEAGIICTPGKGFGPSGEGYVRFALTVEEDRLKQSLERISKVSF
ncbi:LL-diaminopimelate aminotransferase [bacterium]|nr:LL-diaminopimelate aminotransferase [bacterium]